jgi:hypothetical protein
MDAQVAYFKIDEVGNEAALRPSKLPKFSTNSSAAVSQQSAA